MGPIGGWIDGTQEEITNDSTGARRLVCHTQIDQTSVLMWKMIIFFKRDEGGKTQRLQQLIKVQSAERSL